MLIFKQATDDDMFAVLDIRNACRHFFTHNVDYITLYEQERWWTTKEQNGYKVWMVIWHDEDSDPDDCSKAVAGFCMLRTVYDSGRIYATLALKEEFRGYGFGTEIYKFLVNHNDETWIDVRNNNIASINAATKAGFVFHYIGDYISEMVYRKE